MIRGLSHAHQSAAKPLLAKTPVALNGRIAGLNDIGLLTAPDGSVYAMAIMVVANNSDGSAQEIMRDVTKSVIAWHNAQPRGD